MIGRYNIDAPNAPKAPKGTVAYSFFLSDKVVKQKRTVYGTLQMFGDVGGLADFFSIILAFTLSFVSDNLLK